MPVGFPKTNLVKLRYVDTTDINPGFGSTGKHYFRANSLFDPDASGTGHQPNGFDQWSTFYNHYIVVSAKITVYATLLTAGSEAGSCGVVGISLTDDQSVTSDLGTICEQPTTVYAPLTFNNATRPVKISKSYSTKSFYNLTNVSDNVTRLGATISANPAEMAFFTLFCGSASSTLDPPIVNCFVVIEYLAMFSEPKELAQS